MLYRNGRCIILAYMRSIVSVLVSNNIITRNHKLIWEEAASPELYLSYKLHCNCLFPWEDLLMHSFLGPNQPTTTNGILIESAMFPQYTVVTNGQNNSGTRPVPTACYARSARPNNSNIIKQETPNSVYRIV